MRSSFLMAAALMTTTASLHAESVAVTGGAVSGVTSEGVTAFKGIPYAASPTGANRWRAPQPVVAWKGVRDGSAYGHDCAQAPFPPDAAPITTTPSEDCLYLNVETRLGQGRGQVAGDGVDTWRRFCEWRFVAGRLFGTEFRA
jgi:para-nitrobenzyl esterase